MANVKKRLERLEERAGVGCSTCAENPITVVWSSGDEEDPPITCPECGRKAEEIEWTT